MFLLSVTFLALVALLLVLGMASDTAASAGAGIQSSDYSAINIASTVAADEVENLPSSALVDTICTILLILWPLFWIEHLFSVLASRGSSTTRQRLAALPVCLVPPLRMAMPSPVMNGRLWLPALGWQNPGRELHRNLDRTLSKPMLFIGLSILPVLLLEGSLATWLTDTPELNLFLHSATGFIWFAFTLEFIVMLNTTEKKLAYVKAHWIELAIIILPLVSFLRTLRILPASKAIRVHKLAKMARTYRMRGLIGRTVRALALLEVVSRLRRENPVAKLARLRETHEEKLLELNELQMEIMKLENAANDDGLQKDSATQPRNTG